MKILYAILILLLSCSSANAQKIYFTDTTNEWYYNYAYWYFCGNSHIRYTDDSVMYGRQYFLLGTQWVREDSANGKVYVLHDSIDYILYDYQLNIGDTLYTIFPNKSNGYKILSNIDSFRMDSVWYKVQYFQNGSSGWPITIIEGVGCMQGLFFPYMHNNTQRADRIVCFLNNSRKPVFSKPVQSFDNTDSCYVFHKDLRNGGGWNISVEESPILETSIIIRPHPATQNSIISIDEQIEPDRLVITNITGQVISNKGISGTHTIPLGETIIHPGNYFYVLTDISGNIYRGRFVYQ